MTTEPRFAKENDITTEGVKGWTLHLMAITLRENAKAIFKWPVLCFRFISSEKVISCQDSAIIKGFETDI